ncbi:nucleoside deaminase, partial [Methylobacterium sp. WL18]
MINTVTANPIQDAEHETANAAGAFDRAFAAFAVSCSA